MKVIHNVSWRILQASLSITSFIFVSYQSFFVLEFQVSCSFHFFFLVFVGKMGKVKVNAQNILTLVHSRIGARVRCGKNVLSIS